MTDSTNYNAERFQREPVLAQVQSILQISQDGWQPQAGCVGKKQYSGGSGDNPIKSITEKTFQSEDTTPGFSRLDAHGGPGLLMPASLKDNLRKAVVEQLSKDGQAKYANEGYHLHKDNQDSDLSAHIAVDAREKALENDIVKKAFGTLSLTDQYQIFSGKDGSCTSDYTEATQHFEHAISNGTHDQIKALEKSQYGKGFGPGPWNNSRIELL